MIFTLHLSHLADALNLPSLLSPYRSCSDDNIVATNNWIPRNWEEKGVKKKKLVLWSNFNTSSSRNH
jgi:hypothetical protein